ncbi:hypothetical protein [Xanthobacter autotrophicus]|uniref:hypothetical protein n=1 Tax=Xanthobacter autotrophicus TaxID=280 RepID=UPI0024A68BB2|nr:hypothetical protein [Xanthobacter autotrophicus]MDI4655902.1 hypothetical protein [Xanthobacter autotrophicus]
MRVAGLVRFVCVASLGVGLAVAPAAADTDRDRWAEVMRALPLVNEAHKAGEELPSSSPFRKIGTEEIAPYVVGSAFTMAALSGGIFTFLPNGELKFEAKHQFAGISQDRIPRYGRWETEDGCLRLRLTLPDQKLDECYVIYASDKIVMLGINSPRIIAMMMAKN